MLLLLENQTDVLFPPPALKFLLKISVTFPTRAKTAGELQSPHIAMIQIILLLCIFHPPAQPKLALIVYSDYSLCFRANFPPSDVRSRVLTEAASLLMQRAASAPSTINVPSPRSFTIVCCSPLPGQHECLGDRGVKQIIRMIRGLKNTPCSFFF